MSSVKKLFACSWTLVSRNSGLSYWTQELCLAAVRVGKFSILPFKVLCLD